MQKSLSGRQEAERNRKDWQRVIRAAIFDIDDTLFDTKTRRFVPSAIKSLKQLREKGVLVVLATGRPPLSAGVIWKEGVRPDYMVCINGHLILDSKGEVVREETFDKELSGEIFEYCRKRKIGLLWKYPDKIYEYIYAEVFRNFYAKSEEASGNVIRGKTDIHLFRRPDGGCLGCSAKEAEEFNEAFYGRCKAVKIDEESSDLLLFGVNKKSAVERLMTLLEIDKEECIAFGDNMNDVELLQYAGVGVCMGNGSEELKRYADYVTKPLWEDGVLHALSRYRLLS